MAEAWKTRSGEAGDGQTPQAGDDLAEIRRKTQSSRGRASLEEEAARQAAAKKARLENRSARARVMESIPVKPLLISLAALCLAALLVTIGLPAIQKALNPPLSREGLNQISTQLQLQAEKNLGVRAGKPSVQEEPGRFLLTWRTPPGKQKFSGGFTTSPCSLTLAVNRDSGKVSKLRQQGCS